MQVRRTSRVAPDAAEAGFSLVELLVVVGIIGLIASIAAPEVLRYLGSAKADTTRTQMRNVESALELYYIDNARYPTTQEGLGVLTAKRAYLRNASAVTDGWGRAFIYESPVEGRPFALRSLGSDGRPGGEGTAVDIVSE